MAQDRCLFDSPDIGLQRELLFVPARGGLGERMEIRQITCVLGWLDGLVGKAVRSMAPSKCGIRIVHC